MTLTRQVPLTQAERQVLAGLARAELSEVIKGVYLADDEKVKRSLLRTQETLASALMKLV